MKRIAFVLLSVVLMLLVSHAGADAKIRVVATIPDLADMARNIGGDLLEVKSLATGVENTHAVPMKPSFAMLLNRADVLLLMGLGLEHTFLPALLEAARNPKILRERSGLYRLLSVHYPTRSADTHRPGTGRTAPHGQPTFQPRSGLW